jgi:PiT family inorganic phosphate transporter
LRLHRDAGAGGRWTRGGGRRSWRAAAILVGDESSCAAAGASAALSTSAVANGIHWFSGGMVGFARGWNDAPKIAALALLALPDSMDWRS